MTDGDNTDKTPEQHSTKKWYDHKPSPLTKAIAALVIYGVFIFFDAHDLWPWSRGWAVAVGIPATIALLYLEAFATGAISFFAFLMGSAVILFAGLTIYSRAPLILPEETEIHGWLLPASDVTPDNGCQSRPTPGSLLMIFGTNGIQGNGGGPFIPIRVGMCPALVMTRSADGLSVDAEAYDNAGNLIYRIEANEFHLVPGQYSYSRRPDRSTLAVYDRAGRERLFVRYLNSQVLRVRGVFSCKGGPPVTIKDDEILGTNVFSHSCFSVRGPAVGLQFN